MSNKTRSILKLIAIIIVLLLVMMELGWVIIPVMATYKFWLMIISFAMVLLASK